MSDSTTNLNSFNGLIIFDLNDKLFCANIDDVFATINPVDYPNNFKNSYLINSHLVIESLTISVIDLHNLFGMKKNKISPMSRFICMDINGQAFGFLADKIEEVLTLHAGIRSDIKFIKPTGEKFLSGKVKYLGTVFNLPNFQKIINESLVHHKMNWRET